MIQLNICQEICPGVVETEIFNAGGWMEDNDKEPWAKKMGVSYLRDSDIAQTVQFMLMVPYTVNITDMIVKPVGERF